MEKYIVTHCNNIESHDLVSFDSIEKAKKFIEKELKKYIRIDTRDTSLEGSGKYFWFEIYDRDTRTEEDRWGNCLFDSYGVYYERHRH